MSLKRIFRLPLTLVFRLTLWYSAIFAACIILSFVFLNIFITTFVNEQINQILKNEAAAFFTAVEGLEKVPNRVDSVIDLLGRLEENVFIRIIQPDGDKFASQKISSKDIGVNQALVKKLVLNVGAFETIHVPQLKYKVRVVYMIVGRKQVFQAGMSMEKVDYITAAFQRFFKIIIFLVIPFAALIGWFMASRALMGVKEITNTAIRIYNGEYDSRVPIKGRGQEIDDLAVTINNMLERIQKLILGMKEMTDNIAHDLRSPITRIRGIAETTMITAKSIPEYELMTGSIIEDCDRLLAIINMMLDISEADAGISKLNKSALNPSALLEEACELFQPIADDKRITIITDFRSDITIYADEQKLQRVVANLLDNAVKFSPSGSTVSISVSGDGTGVNLSIKDNGIGISPDDLPYIFKRFYRCDPNRSTAGVGLGLSWAQAIVRAHGGNISVTSTLNEGSTFIVTIPFNCS
jgi:signal transduction histidine kinase